FSFAAAHADAARLSRQVTPKARQSRQQMLQLRQLNLQLAFPRAGALREDVEDQRGAVENFGAEDFFQVAALRGGKFIVEDDRVHIQPAAKVRELPGLAF